MAAASRPEDLDVSRDLLGRRLHTRPGSFDFFQAVRLLERLLGGSRQPVGLFAHPTREVVRFVVNNALVFPPSQIHSIEWNENGQPVITVNFMGLTGPLGVLPQYYTELVNERIRAKDFALAEFLNIFNHRAISLFYQAWEKYRFFVGFERDRQDRFSGYLLHLIGLGTDGLRDLQPVADTSLLFYSGLFSLQPRSAAALEQVLGDYFGVPVEAEQFVGAWHALDPASQCGFEGDESPSELLACGVVVGDAVWEQQSRVRIRLGPLTVSQYLDFLPSGSAYEPLRALTRFFSGDELEFEVQLILRREEVPPCELGSEQEASPMLGWLSWMHSRATFDRNPGDTILLLN